MCQARFRKGRSCVGHVVRLSEHSKSPDCRSHDRRHFFLFYIKRAFDIVCTLWHAKLLEKMQAMGIIGRMYQFVQTFLDSRRMAVKVGHAKSQTHTLDMGVPQGSVIAPTLFSLMLHDIHRGGSPAFSMSLYAGDLATWADSSAKIRRRRWLPNSKSTLTESRDT